MRLCRYSPAPAHKVATAGAATSSDLSNPLGVAVDGSGNVYIADTGNADVEEVFAGTALRVTRAGTGTGTLSSSPAGISCGTVCESGFRSGTTVTVTATPSSGSIFAGWSGACTGMGTCKVTMNVMKAVTATFKKVVPPPNTTITGNHISGAERRATIDFTGSGDVGKLHFQCKLDQGSWTSCASPHTYTGLAHGSHTFEVRAVDARGERDPTPAKLTFKV